MTTSDLVLLLLAGAGVLALFALALALARCEHADVRDQVRASHPLRVLPAADDAPGARDE